MLGGFEPAGHKGDRRGLVGYGFTVRACSKMKVSAMRFVIAESPGIPGSMQVEHGGTQFPWFSGFLRSRLPGRPEGAKFKGGMGCFFYKVGDLKYNGAGLKSVVYASLTYGNPVARGLPRHGWRS